MAKNTLPMTMFQKIFLIVVAAIVGGSCTALVTMQKNIVRLSETSAVMVVQISHQQDQINGHTEEDVITEVAHVLAILKGN